MENRMSLSSHLVELRKKHASLEHRIEQELRNPGSDDLQIAELKKEKLRLKDEITRLGGVDAIH
ncbi:MAG: YdcH family protein [Pikeienuella sp.]